MRRSTRSSLKDILTLAGVKKSREIGERGPLIASRSISEDEKNPELRRFEVVFGRDSIFTAYELLDYYPRLAEATIKRLAELQGTRIDAVTEEEPGRIHHEHRPGGAFFFEQLRAKWGHPEDKELIYYGSVDATPLYLKLFCDYLKRTDNWNVLNVKVRNKDDCRIILKETFENAVDWIIKRTDKSEYGFIEFQRSNPRGIANQVWKDSGDSFFHEDGKSANHDFPIAAVEVQGYAYDALLGAADVFKRQDRKDKTKKCIEKAEIIKNNVINKLWMEDKQYFAIGLDRGKDGKSRQIRIIASNPGHLLNSKMLFDPGRIHYKEAIIRKLFSDDLFCASGIRTLGKNEARYNPGSYHNGSVWPFDNSFIAGGLEKHGFLALAEEVRLRLLRATAVHGKMAEFFRGGNGIVPEINTETVRRFNDETGKEVVIEQPPQEIQAWTVTAVFTAKRKMGERFLRHNKLPCSLLQGSLF
ncbi:MAG: hypothetical protein M1536_04200 [Firmicutes bacterium]|nr:hypothetical protein [Bacillota bacterium]